MITANDLRAGMRVLDADGDFIGTILGVAGDSVRLRQEGVVDGEHDVPLTRFARVDGESAYLDGAWSTILTTLGGLAAGAAATVGGAAHAAERGIDRMGDRIRDGVHGDTVHRDPLHRDPVTPATYNDPVEPERRMGFWPWLLLIAAAIAAFLAFKSCSTAEAPAPMPAEPGVEQATPATPATPAATGPVESVTLADNSKLDITPGTITYNLYKFVTSGDAVPKTFTFDKLNFDTGSAAIRAEDQPTIDSIGAIMKAYPKVKASVVGYTDATGDKAANEKLSAERSANVVKAIVAKGVDAGRLDSKAGGIAETKGGADQNARRTDLVVTEK